MLSYLESPLCTRPVCQRNKVKRCSYRHPAGKHFTVTQRQGEAEDHMAICHRHRRAELPCRSWKRPTFWSSLHKPAAFPLDFASLSVVQLGIRTGESGTGYLSYDSGAAQK